MIFIDTSIFICATMKFEKSYKKAKHLINNYEWMTTKHVVEEVNQLKKRRFEIYKRIIHFWPLSQNKSLTVNDIFKRCFKPSVTNFNLNDERHLKNLFNSVIFQLGLKKDQKLTEEILEKFQKTIFSLLNDIKIKTGLICYKLNDPEFKTTHIIEPEYLTYYKKFRKGLKKKIKIFTRSEKNDLNIISAFICYAHENNMDVFFVSNDNFFVNIKKQIFGSVEIL